ncbi:MAG: TerC family protein [Pyrinomonadaceae bacterium]
MNGSEYPLWVWILFFAIVLAALFVDVGIVNRRSHSPTRKETFVWSAVWVSLALAFDAFIFYQFGAFKAKEFVTGYLIEMSLSIDNLFVFLLIFGYFRVPKKYQHRVLFWGIFMALVLRMVMIFAGAQLVESFNWLLYVFGAFLIYTGIKMFGEDEAFEPEDSSIVRLTTKFVRIRHVYDGEKFFVIENGVRSGTLLLLVLMVINFADLIFAVDSIPAIFGITTDRFIVYTSNIFAILGLRTFFFLLVDLAEKFHLLKYGLAFVLSFIGLKMLLPLIGTGLLKLMGDDSASAFGVFLHRFENHDFEHVVINISLGIVILALICSVILSLIFPPAPGDERGDDDSYR